MRRLSEMDYVMVGVAGKEEVVECRHLSNFAVPFLTDV
jgi:hypothetical protein